MSHETATPSIVSERPTQIRHLVVAVTTLMAVLLYLDRFAVGIASEYIREDLRMTQTQMSWFLSAFFWSYALAQVPAGLLSDRLGARRMLSIYIVAWSAFTGLLGWAHQVWQILQLRLWCGISQAGAYPTAGGMIRIWYPVFSRGTANSIVALGGRAGGVLAPILTAWLITIFAAQNDPTALTASDVLDIHKFFVPEKEQSRAARQISDPLLNQWLLIEFRPIGSAPRNSGPSAPGLSFDWDDWIPSFTTLPELPYQEFAQRLGKALASPDFLGNVELSSLKLPPEAVALAGKGVRSGHEQATLNRLVFETAFPGAIKRYRGSGWRPTMLLYGTCGLAVAVIFLLVSRNSPRLHPWCNQAECDFIQGGADSKVTPVEAPPFPLRQMLTNVSLWGNSLMQVFTNIGWVFVVTWLPRYLDKVHGIPLAGQAVMTAIPTAAGVFGMYAGGWWTDRAASAYGRKWGRRLPVVITRFTAAAGYGICLLLSLCFVPDPSNNWLPWAYVAALCVMVFSVDMGNPAVWAYAQDVGGKYTGSILGWANMWGNLGAAVAPLIYNQVLGELPSLARWNAMFGVCLLAFVVSGLCGFVMDSTKQLVHDQPD